MNWNNGGYFHRPPSPYLYESITDQGGKFVPGLVKPCTHVKIESFYNGVSFPTSSYNVPWSSYEIIAKCDEAVIPVNWNADGTVGLSNIVPLKDFNRECNSFVDSVARSVREHIPVEVSIPNFLLELDDIPKTVTSLGKLSRYGPDTLNGLRTAVSSRKVNLGKTVADHWLAWNFGVMPTINDVTSFIGSHANVEKRIAFLKRTYKRETRFRRSRCFTESYDTPWVYHGSTSIGHAFYTRKVVRRSTRISAGGYVYHDLSGFDDADNRFLAYASAYGFTKPLSVIWEATPFSFLIDYVSNVGDLVNSVSAPVFDGTITLKSAWTTRKVITDVTSHVKIVTPRGESTSGPYQRTVRTDFTRSAGLLTSKGVNFGSNMSLTQILNTLALLA